MTIQQCKYVLKILDCGSFNEAAKQLFIAQSSLSVNIKALEQELQIKIFERAGTGVLLTEEGAEFVRYARQITDHSDFIVDRYTVHTPSSRLHVSTQHYDFVADIFSKLVNEATEKQYHFSLREMRTYDVIKETESAYCDIGVIAIKSSDIGVMERYLHRKGITITPFLKAYPHIYVRNGHPLSKLPLVSLELLMDYPSVSYEQGEHSSTFFTEELVGGCSPRQIEISDRASLMNILLATDCYTVGTGIMPSLLNENRIVSVPFECDEFYSIGYITRRDRNLSSLAQTFIDSLHTAAKTLQK